MEKPPIVETFTQPFPRAHIKVAGRTPQESLDNAKEFCKSLRTDLPKFSIVWKPVPFGFDQDIGRHVCKIAVTYGPSIEAAQKVIAALS